MWSSENCPSRCLIFYRSGGPPGPRAPFRQRNSSAPFAMSQRICRPASSGSWIHRAASVTRPTTTPQPLHEFPMDKQQGDNRKMPCRARRNHAGCRGSSAPPERCNEGVFTDTSIWIDHFRHRLFSMGIGYTGCPTCSPPCFLTAVLADRGRCLRFVAAAISPLPPLQPSPPSGAILVGKRRVPRPTGQNTNRHDIGLPLETAAACVLALRLPCRA